MLWVPPVELLEREPIVTEEPGSELDEFTPEPTGVVLVPEFAGFVRLAMLTDEPLDPVPVEVEELFGTQTPADAVRVAVVPVAVLDCGFE